MKHKVLVPGSVGALAPGVITLVGLCFFILPIFGLAVFIQRIVNNFYITVILMFIFLFVIYPQLLESKKFASFSNGLNKILEQLPLEKMGLFDPNVYERRLSNAYRWSIQAALNTNYPHGIIYILENTLEQLKNCGLDFLPFRNSENSQYGMPNQTNLKNVITQAYRIKKIWSQSTNFDQSRYMEELRMKIKPEEMYLDVAEFDIPANMKKVDIYRFDYTEEDYRNEMSLSQQSYQNPPIIKEPIVSHPNLQQPESENHKPSPTKNNQNKTILNFDEWLQQNSALEYFSEEEQKQAYQKYLASHALSFEDFVKQNSGLEYFSQEDQQKAYQKYLSAQNF